MGVPFVQVPVHGWRRYRSLHWVSSVSVQVYCELLARVPVTTTPAPLFEYLTPRGKALQRTFGILIELLAFSSFSFLILDSKVGSVVTKVCFGLFGVIFS